MPSLETAIGLAAAFCTTFSYLPQLKKCYVTKRAGDLSLKMFLVLALGVGLWCLYGVMKGDIVIMGANGLSLMFLAVILYYKLRERFGWFASGDAPAPQASEA